MIYSKTKTDSNEQNKVKAQNIRRLASLERKKEDVMEEIIQDAQTRDKEHRRQWVVLLDGALHLWDMVSKCLKGIDYVGILDIIHVVEYLYLVGNALHKTNESNKNIYHRPASIEVATFVGDGALLRGRVIAKDQVQCGLGHIQLTLSYKLSRKGYV